MSNPNASAIIIFVPVANGLSRFPKIIENEIPRMKGLVLISNTRQVRITKGIIITARDTSSMNPERIVDAILIR